MSNTLQPPKQSGSGFIEDLGKLSIPFALIAAKEGVDIIRKRMDKKSTTKKSTKTSSTTSAKKSTKTSPTSTKKSTKTSSTKKSAKTK